MRHLAALLTLLLATTALSAGTAPTASAAPSEQTPCDGLVLRAQHAASADFFDTNGDRLECWPPEGSTAQPGDNYRLSSPPPGPDSRKFYSWGSQYGRPTSISFVDPATRTFGGLLEGQEDDPDFNGCQGVCFQTLSYDDNDYFYFDLGSGSTKVSLSYFEAHALGSVRLTMVYSRIAAESSVFTFEYVPPPAQSRPSPPRHVHAHPGNHRAHVHWAAPTRGRPVDAYQVRGAGQLRLVDADRRSLTVRGLVNGRLYAFQVRAHNASGWGPWSRAATVRPHR